MNQRIYISRRQGLFRSKHQAGISKSTVDEFSNLLDSDKIVEEDLQRFLSNNLEIIASAFMRIGGFIIPKFAFGNDFISDFMIADWAQEWVLTLIELEPSTARAFTKAGTPARKLASAMKQLADWQNWIEKHRDYFLEKMRKHHKTFLTELKDEFDNDEVPSYMTLLEDWYFPYIYHTIVIGRRGPNFQEDQENRRILSRVSSTSLRIYSYDWLLDVARHNVLNNAAERE